jgi:hypothetical protein
LDSEYNILTAAGHLAEVMDTTLYSGQYVTVHDIHHVLQSMVDCSIQQYTTTDEAAAMDSDPGDEINTIPETDVSDNEGPIGDDTTVLHLCSITKKSGSDNDGSEDEETDSIGNLDSDSDFELATQVEVAKSKDEPRDGPSQGRLAGIPAGQDIHLPASSSIHIEDGEPNREVLESVKHTSDFYGSLREVTSYEVMSVKFDIIRHKTTRIAGFSTECRPLRSQNGNPIDDEGSTYGPTTQTVSGHMQGDRKVQTSTLSDFNILLNFNSFCS